MTTVFGIDIQKGNIRSASVHPRFCFARVTDGEIVEEGTNLSIPRLFRILHAVRPDVLAVDSVQEIAKDDAGLYRFLASLPPETALVQVTGDGVTMESLPQVAARYHLKFDKTSPAEEARATALIASYGGGYEVVAFEGVTQITVSRSRSLGRGGWSQNRYARKVHGGVKVKAREIEDKLAEAGIQSSSVSQLAFGGSSRTVIEARAPRGSVPVSSLRCGDIQVRVEPKKRDRILYVSREAKTPYVIVGVDPGTTVGVAVLGLDGRLLHLESVRAQSPAELISVISSLGIPVLVATDKAEMPAGVEKIRRVFGAVGWTPKKDILVKEKYVADEGYSFADDHQRDSLAAALMAYRSYLPKFENIGKRVPSGISLDTVRASIIKGKPLSALLPGDEGNAPEETAAAPESVFDEKDYELFRMEGEIAKLRELTQDLSAELEKKTEELKKLQRRLAQKTNEQMAEILVSAEIQQRDTELLQVKKALRKEERRSKNLRLRLERMKRYVALSAGDGCLALKVLQLLSRDAVRAMDDEMGVGEGDILYILKIDGWGRTAIQDIAAAHVRAVILPKQTFDRAKEQHLIDEFRAINLPLVSGANLSPRVRGKIGVVDEQAMMRAEEAWRMSQDQYLKDKHTQQLHGMVTEYQVQRRRDVHNFGIDPASLPSADREDIQTPPKPKKQPAKEPVKVQVTVRQEPVKEMPQEPPKPKKQPVSKPKPADKPDILTSVLRTYRSEREKELKHQ